jgi:hypothetical protein
MARWRFVPATASLASNATSGRLSPAKHAPWRRFLAALHRDVHGAFVDEYLSSLDVGAPELLDEVSLVTYFELQLDPATGRIRTVGILQSSGRLEFDVAVLGAVNQAFPRTVPGELASADGLVYLHWRLHRDPVYACSTYFARPLELRVATPGVGPGPKQILWRSARE